MTIEQHVAAALGSSIACRRVLRELVDRDARGLLVDARWDAVRAELERVRRPPTADRSRSIWVR